MALGVAAAHGVDGRARAPRCAPRALRRGDVMAPRAARPPLVADGVVRAQAARGEARSPPRRARRAALSSKRRSRRAPPRSSNASLEGPGVVALASLSDERLCSFVREWAETEFVRAVIVEARPGGYLIDVGTQTFVPSSQTWMLPGEAVEVRVRSFGCSDGLARVGAIRNVFNAIDDTVRVGDDEDATVICHHGQGLMVRFRGFCGVVAESEIARRGLCGLLPGERVRVTVLELRRRSAVLSLVASTSA